jgi:hypothetical protein
MLYNNNPLRTLARSIEWQIRYRNAKEIPSFKLIRDEEDLSIIQINFLQWLSTYNYLREQMLNGDYLLSEEILADDMRVDAYLRYKEIHKNDDKNKTDKPETTRHPTIPSLIFRPRKH